MFSRRKLAGASSEESSKSADASRRDSWRKPSPGGVNASAETMSQVTGSIEDYTDEQIMELYNQTLDHLLIAPHAKEQLLATQTKEKKWQMIQMHVSGTPNDTFLKRNLTLESILCNLLSCSLY